MAVCHFFCEIRNLIKFVVWKSPSKTTEFCSVNKNLTLNLQNFRHTAGKSTAFSCLLSGSSWSDFLQNYSAWRDDSLSGGSSPSLANFPLLGRCHIDQIFAYLLNRKTTKIGKQILQKHIRNFYKLQILLFTFLLFCQWPPDLLTSWACGRGGKFLNQIACGHPNLNRLSDNYLS